MMSFFHFLFASEFLFCLFFLCKPNYTVSTQCVMILTESARETINQIKDYGITSEWRFF